MSSVDWSRYNLPAIRNLIADVDVCDGADRVLAWDGLASAVRDQHKRLLTAADSLAAVWPPAKNDSALEFQRQVQGLADSMNETLARAEDTKAGLQGVVNAFGTAQSKIRDLASGREGVSNDWMPRFVDHAEDKYDEHAQAAMREAEAAISDHGSQIKPPALYKMDTGKSDDGKHVKAGGAESSGGKGSRGLRATPVPVPASDGSPTTNLPGPAGNGPSGNVGSGISSGQDSSGPVLSGVAPAAPPLGPGIANPVFPNIGPGSGLGPLPVPSTGVGGTGPSALGILPIGSGGFGAIGGVSGGVGSPGSRRPVPVRRGLPSGTVIGEESERGLGTRGLGAGGATGTGAMPMVGGMPGGRGASRRGKGAVDGDADQQWETYEGVTPVIRPDNAPVRHDPGPGIIGFDR